MNLYLHSIVSLDLTVLHIQCCMTCNAYVLQESVKDNYPIRLACGEYPEMLDYWLVVTIHLDIFVNVQ